MKTSSFTIIACSLATLTSAADPNAVEPRQVTPNSAGFFAILQPIRTLPTIAIEQSSAVFSILPVSELTIGGGSGGGGGGGGGGSSTRSNRPASASATGTGTGNGAGAGSIRPSSTVTPRTTPSGGSGPASTARPTATGGAGGGDGGAGAGTGGGAGVGVVGGTGGGGTGGGGPAGNGPALVSSTRRPTGTVTTAAVGGDTGASDVVYVPEAGASSLRGLSGAGVALLSAMLVALAI